MRKHLLALVAAGALATVSFGAFADDTTRGAANGAAAGDAAAGPVGAIVGGTVGGALGAASDITHAIVPGPDPAPVVVAPPSSVKQTTCVKDAAGNQRCNSVGVRPNKAFAASASRSAPSRRRTCFRIRYLPPQRCG